MPFLHPYQNQEALEVFSGASVALVLGKYLVFKIFGMNVSRDEMTLQMILERKSSFDLMKSRMPRPPSLLVLYILS